MLRAIKNVWTVLSVIAIAWLVFSLIQVWFCQLNGDVPTWNLFSVIARWA